MTGPLLTVAQAAERLGISPSQVYELIYAGSATAVRLPSPRGRSPRNRGALRIEQSEISRLRDLTTAPSSTTEGAST